MTLRYLLLQNIIGCNLPLYITLLNLKFIALGTVASIVVYDLNLLHNKLGYFYQVEQTHVGSFDLCNSAVFFDNLNLFYPIQAGPRISLRVAHADHQSFVAICQERLKDHIILWA